MVLEAEGERRAHLVAQRYVGTVRAESVRAVIWPEGLVAGPMRRRPHLYGSRVEPVHYGPDVRLAVPGHTDS